jgi:hypothetical protein
MTAYSQLGQGKPVVQGNQQEYEKENQQANLVRYPHPWQNPP